MDRSCGLENNRINYEFLGIEYISSGVRGWLVVVLKWFAESRSRSLVGGFAEDLVLDYVELCVPFCLAISLSSQVSLHPRWCQMHVQSA